MIDTALDFFAGTGQFGSLTHNSTNHRKSENDLTDVGALLQNYPMSHPEQQTVASIDDVVDTARGMSMRDLWSAV